MIALGLNHHNNNGLGTVGNQKLMSNMLSASLNSTNSMIGGPPQLESFFSKNQETNY